MNFFAQLEGEANKRLIVFHRFRIFRVILFREITYIILIRISITLQ